MILSTTQTTLSQLVTGLLPGSPGLDTKPYHVKSVVDKMALESFFKLLFSRLFDISTSSCAHSTITLSFSSICLCHSSLLLLIPFPPNSPLIPSAQVALGLPRFLLPGGLHFIIFLVVSPLPFSEHVHTILVV